MTKRWIFVNILRRVDCRRRHCRLTICRRPRKDIPIPCGSDYVDCLRWLLWRVVEDYRGLRRVSESRGPGEDVTVPGSDDDFAFLVEMLRRVDICL